MQIITSKSNNLFKKIKKLQIKKYREQEKLFMAEGRKFLDFNIKPKYIIVSEAKKDSYELEEENLIIMSDNLFKEISSQQNSQGLIFIYKFINSDINLIKNNIVILDQIQDPGNLGTIIRLVDAVGIKDIILLKGSVDIYNEKVIRSSMGSIFNLNIIYMEKNEMIQLLHDAEYNIISTALIENTVDYKEMVLQNKNAIIFGNEGNGVSKELLDISNQTVKIPIYGIAESLNVAIASGIILYKWREKFEFQL